MKTRGFGFPWFHDFHDFHDFLDDTSLCDVDLGNLHFQLEFAVWLSAKATLGPKKPSLALTAAYGWDPKKKHNFFYGFPRVNYGLSTGFIKTGFCPIYQSTGLVRDKYGISTGKSWGPLVFTNFIWNHTCMKCKLEQNGDWLMVKSNCGSIYLESICLIVVQNECQG